MVGVAGAQEKCDYVVNELGFDACVSYKSNDFEEQLSAACPDGIDIYYENVAGKVLETVIPLLNFGSRIPVCGLISQYNATARTLPPFAENETPIGTSWSRNAINMAYRLTESRYYSDPLLEMIVAAVGSRCASRAWVRFQRKQMKMVLHSGLQEGTGKHAAGGKSCCI